MEPKISVIIPVYNVEKYLEKCINSVIEQTYTNLEIILVNDGSTDSSGEICDKYKQLDNRIVVFHKENGGLSDARNYGIERANGEYIAFLDSDDWVDFKYIEILYENLRNYNADISICNFRRVHDENELLNNNNNIILYNNIEALQQIYTNKSVQTIVAWNKLYKSNILKKNRFPKGKIHEDEYLIPILLYSAKIVVYTDKELVYYRQTPNSIMNSKFRLENLDYLYAIEHRNKFFLNNNLIDIYTRGINLYAEQIVRFYYLINKSKLTEKKLLLSKLRGKLIEIKNNYMLSNKIHLFIVSPNLYNLIFQVAIPKIYLSKCFIKTKIKNLINLSRFKYFKVL